MKNNNYIITGIFFAILLIGSIIFINFFQYNVHKLIHVLTLLTTIFLAFLSFRGFFNYRIVKLLFPAFAFLLFGVSEVVELIDDIEHQDDPFSINEIRDYIIIGAIALFAMGTLFKIRK